MKKIFLPLFLAIGAICSIGANAQTVRIYKAGTMVYSSTDADSVVFSETTVPFDESIYAFSVSEQRQVIFAPGNLQYTRSTNTWAFAANQYDVIGEANVSGGALADKIDLFGWSASNTTAPFGVSSSEKQADYAGSFVDWGGNKIGDDAPNTWRTLTKNEWKYLFKHTRWTMARVNGILGFMLLSDGFVAPSDMTISLLSTGDLPYNTLTFSESEYASNVYTAEEFARIETKGCVFLPAAGVRSSAGVSNVGMGGAYWSATPDGADNANYLLFTNKDMYPEFQNYRYFGLSVRLVKDFGEPASGKFSVAAGKQITFSGGNLQYTQSTNSWAFATNQYDIIGAANVSEGALADKIDLFGWSTGNTATPFGVSISDTDADYKGAFVDWGTNTIGSYAPDTWRTLTKDEWDYLFRTRPNAEKRNGIARIYISEDKSQYADGLILLPDDWTCPEGITFKEGGASGDNPYADHQTFTLAQWQALEEAQAVFLPATGERYNGATVGDMDYGFYWSATAEETEDEGLLRAYTFYVEPDNIMLDVYDRKSGQSVRLVRDVQTPAGIQAHAEADLHEDTEAQAVSVYKAGTIVYSVLYADSVIFSKTNKFSVGASKQVTFASGNLQYTRSSNTWAFATTQYEAIGMGNTIDYELADKIDLFGWSADNTKAPFGVSSALVNPPYAGDFVDWGVNTIGADAPNTWRTLTYEEWQYLLDSRTNATQLMGVARINLNESGTEYTNGLILLPDDWTCPEGITFKSGFAAVGGAQEYANYQTFPLAQWQRLEAAGAVFLPAAGFREAAVDNVGIGGYYWSATANDTDGAKGMYFLSNTVRAMEWKASRYYGRSVRLVKDL